MLVIMKIRNRNPWGKRVKKSRKHPALIADNADISVTFYAAFCLQQVAWKSPRCSLGNWWLASISAAVSLPQTRCLHHEAIWPSICVQWKLQRSTSEVSGGPGRSRGPTGPPGQRGRSGAGLGRTRRQSSPDTSRTRWGDRSSTLIGCRGASEWGGDACLPRFTLTPTS